MIWTYGEARRKEEAMAKNDVDQKRVRVSTAPPPESAIKRVDAIFIVVTQAFCPKGDNLIIDTNPKFDGYPGIKIHVECDGESGDVVLSPFHGDDTKKGRTNWRAGARLKVTCPICGTALPKLASCRCEGGGDLVRLYLTPKLSDSHLLAMCNIWGCRRSRTIDNWQIISEYLDGEIEG